MAHPQEPLKAEALPVTHGSGNVFADLGFDDAEVLQVKAGLTHQIALRIQALGLTQTRAGARLGIGQPDVSKLMQGRYTGYSIDRLIALLNALDVDVEIVVRPPSATASPRRGHVRVLETVA
jgi:predicted XRE-type DNA-binding protein